MSGNVDEWCSDGYEDYSSGAQTNPKGPYDELERVYRGGDWFYDAGFCRSSSRSYSFSDYAYDYVGLRLSL